MNQVVLTGKLEDKIVKDNHTLLKIRVLDEGLKTTYLIRCSVVGSVETYCNSELTTNDEVIVLGRLVGRMQKTDTGYLYYTEVRVRYINKLEQMSYGRYNES